MLRVRSSLILIHANKAEQQDVRPQQAVSLVRVAHHHRRDEPALGHDRRGSRAPHGHALGLRPDAAPLGAGRRGAAPAPERATAPRADRQRADAAGQLPGDGGAQVHRQLQQGATVATARARLTGAAAVDAQHKLLLGLAGAAARHSGAQGGVGAHVIRTGRPDGPAEAARGQGRRHQARPPR
eukprot:5608576-Prymnesium_polylepis.1